MVFRALPQMERCTDRGQEDAPVGRAHLLADLIGRRARVYP
jgi:hypothetical protein